MTTRHGRVVDLHVGDVARRSRAYVTWSAFALSLALALPGCGRCGGAIRVMHGMAEPHNEPLGAEPVIASPHARFSLVGDGPRKPSDDLLAAAGIGPDRWFLIEEASGRRVPSTITASAGGHLCLRGVSFALVPEQPLGRGDYTLVLVLDGLRWPLVLDDEAQRGTHGGKPALVRRYRVVEATQ